MGFTLKSATLVVVQILLASSAISTVAATPPVSNYDSAESIEDSLDVNNYDHYSKLEHYTQEEYLQLNGGRDPTFDVLGEHELKARQSSYTPVTGATNGGCQHRKKLERLQANSAAEFNLLILAMENIQKTIAETNELSWFGIMGIHGVPHIPWGQPQTGNYDYSRGYCPHSSTIFCTWHRPYLLLMEQWVQEKARRIALQFNGTARTTYTNASPFVRLPYWDWSDPGTQSNIPPVVMQPQITVLKPQPGQLNPVSVTIDNPFYAYKFMSSALRNQYFDGDFRTWDSTRRQPDSNGNSNNQLANSIMQGGFSSRKQETYTALGQTTYNQFNDAIEGVHNAVHVNIGGDNGHMSFLDYSAFDPIFYLHHVNVDRMFSLWQASHPGQYLITSSATATFGRNIDPDTCGCTDNLGTALFPFHLSNGQWWKSDHIKNARDIWQYGYGYDEVPCSYQGRSSSDLRTFTTGRINSLYGPNSQTGMSTTQNSNVGAQSDPATQPKQRKEWFLESIVDNCEIPGSWKLCAFIGDSPSDSNTWELADNTLGCMSSLGNLQMGNTMKKQCKPSVRSLPMTWYLIDKGFVSDGDFKDDGKMVKFLQDKLTWKLARTGEELDLGSFKTLKIAAFSQKITYPAENDPSSLPTHGKPEYEPKITKGKPCGISDVKDVETMVLTDGRTVPVPAVITRRSAKA